MVPVRLVAVNAVGQEEPHSQNRPLFYSLAPNVFKKWQRQLNLATWEKHYQGHSKISLVAHKSSYLCMQYFSLVPIKAWTAKVAHSGSPSSLTPTAFSYRSTAPGSMVASVTSVMYSV